MTMSLPRPQGMRMTREEAETITGGKWHGQQRELIFYGASIDSRLVRPGCMFCCLEGARVDGHDYAATAVGDGAVIVLALRYVDVPVPVLVVSDIALAMADIARAFRRRYPGARWIAVTGSNGKTTVKEMLRVVFSKQGNVHCTQGNYNNHLGVPLTVLATPADCDYVITELGASAPGEIATLADIVKPDCALITSIGPAHLEGFGGLDGVARAKSEIFCALADDGIALFSDYGLEQSASRYGSSSTAIIKIITESAGDRSLTLIGDDQHPIVGEDQSDGQTVQTPSGAVHMQCFGRHNMSNALLSWYCAVSQGLDGEAARAALETVRPVSGRLEVKRSGQHRIYDDSYNANPGSMNSGLHVVSRQSGARLAVLGHMGELGENSVALHQSVGAEAARLGVALMTVGEKARDIGVGFTATGALDYVHVDNHQQATESIVRRLQIGPHAVLIKASRAAGLEEVVADVLDEIEYRENYLGENHLDKDENGEGSNQ